MGNTKYSLEIVNSVQPVPALFPGRFDDPVALLPNPEGMGFDSAEIFNVPDGKSVHSLLNIRNSIEYLADGSTILATGLIADTRCF